MTTEKDGVQNKTYHVNMLKKYIAREPEVDVIHTSNKDNANIAVARGIYKDTDLELGGSTRIRGLSSEKRGQKRQIRPALYAEGLDPDLMYLQICLKKLMRFSTE